MNKKTGIIATVIAIILVIVGVVLFTGTDKSSDKDKGNKQVTEEKVITPEILDDNVTLEDDIKTWVADNKVKEGFYTKVTDKETFVLISGGEKETTGFGISLNEVEQTAKDITVKYEVLAPMEGFEVKNEKAIPNMLLRFETTDLKIKGEIATLESLESPVPSKEDKTKK